MDIRQAIQRASARESLSADEMTQVIAGIMAGNATAAQIGGFLLAMKTKGETAEEIAGAAQALRTCSSRVDVAAPNLVDTCGTGGDGADTFNISTAAGLIAAAGGAHVAKHGNRSASGRCGSADVLEAAGVKLELAPRAVAECIASLGFGFMFAPQHHQAMRHVIPVRKELGIRTLFNLLGPLTNPAGARRQLVGVYSHEWLEPMANALARLGCERAMVVHGEDGLDEISIGTATRIVELDRGAIRQYRVEPEEFGIQRMPTEALRISGVEDALSRLRSVLADEPGPARDVACLNAGAALYIAAQTTSLREGYELARHSLSTGTPGRKLTALAELTHRLSTDFPT